MRRVPLLLALAAASLALPAAATGLRAATPRLAVGGAPLTVRGSGFLARERVLVRVFDAGTSARRAVTTGARGGFRIVFESLSVPSCGDFVVSAAGSDGSRVTWKRVTECPQPPQPLDGLMPTDPTPKPH
jgi:hypothetical protein